MSETADLLHESRVKDHLDVQGIVLWSVSRYDHSLSRQLDREGRGMGVDLLDHTGKRQRDPDIPEWDMLIQKFQVQVSPFPVIFDRRPENVTILHCVGAGGEVIRVKDTDLVIECKVLDRPDLIRTGCPC